MLLIEDDLRFAELVGAWLEEAALQGAGGVARSGVFLEHAESLTSGLASLDGNPPDIMLVDLNLPDSQGLDTCHRLLAHPTQTPIIVLSGLDDEHLAVHSVGLGAQDYLVKGLLDGRMLLRAVRYALERSRLQKELERTRREQSRRREEESLDRMNNRGHAQTTARVLGVGELRKDAPELFENITQRMMELIEKMMEMRIYKVKRAISPSLQQLAQEMGDFRCGPRDVVEVYRAALSRMESPLNPIRNDALLDEGRYLAFELMGRMVSYYRPYALGGTPSSSPSPPAGREATHRHGSS